MDTKEKILDTAQDLFAQAGFAGTSVRQITEGANVNISAINYHFGNKEGLFFAVVERGHSKIEAERFSKLDAYLKEKKYSKIECAVRAFLEPLESRITTRNSLPKMLMRVFNENPEIKKTIKAKIFVRTRERFFGVMQDAFPKLTEAEVRCKFQFMISSMLGAMSLSEEIAPTIKEMPGNKTFIECLINHVLQGIQ